MSEAPRPKLLEPGDAAPWFRARAVGGAPAYVFDTAAGRPILILFFASAGREESRAALAEVAAHRGLFDDVSACFFGVTVDPADEAEGRIAQDIPGIRFFADYDRTVSRLYGAAPEDGPVYHPHWLLLDPALRVLARFPLTSGAEALAALAARRERPFVQDWAPVLAVENVFEPALCRRLIALYEASGGEPSGFMREVDGKTVLVEDPRHKRRRDHAIDDGALHAQLAARINRRLVPAVARAFQFHATRIERHIVACYDAAEAGHFRPHRDNTTKGTAHRRFAVTINLNAGDYEGGDLRFPEFGPRTYRAPTGGAVVFSCSLLHEATPVTAGRRYAYLPFLYDEAAAQLREENAPFLADGLGGYRRAGR